MPLRQGLPMPARGLFLRGGGRLAARAAGLLRLAGTLSAIAIGALAAFAAGLARFLGSELMRGALLMRRAATFAGDFTLLLSAHSRKAPVRGAPIRHDDSPDNL